MYLFWDRVLIPYTEDFTFITGIVAILIFCLTITFICKYIKESKEIYVNKALFISTSVITIIAIIILFAIWAYCMIFFYERGGDLSTSGVKFIGLGIIITGAAFLLSSFAEKENQNKYWIYRAILSICGIIAGIVAFVNSFLIYDYLFYEFYTFAIPFVLIGIPSIVCFTFDCIYKYKKNFSLNIFSIVINAVLLALMIFTVVIMIVFPPLDRIII